MMILRFRLRQHVVGRYPDFLVGNHNIHEFRLIYVAASSFGRNDLVDL
ncbi:MAG: hypothetical protein ABGZ35_05870 [Planctomycetaceae bacterium]|jgi:hypothetical protein